MRDVPENTIERIVHDEVLRKFWLGAVFNAKPYAFSPMRARKFTDEQIRAAVERHGTQSKVAKALGISETTVS